MKRRTKRDLGVLVGAILIIGTIAFANSQFQRGGNRAAFEKLLKKLEAEQTSEDHLRWQLVRETKGSLRSGAKFPEELKTYDERPNTTILGFMTPLEQFRDVTEFMFLPIPLECYFCAMPPDRDVLYVFLKEGETETIYKEPVMLRGTFKLHEGPKQQFFYSLENAVVDKELSSGTLTRKGMKLEHMVGGEGHEFNKDDLLEPVIEDSVDPREGD